MPEPLLVTGISMRLKRLDLPDSAEIPDLLQTESGSVSDPGTVMHVAFRGERIDAIGDRTTVEVLIPLLDLIHLRDRLTGELLSADREGVLRISDRDRR